MKYGQVNLKIFTKRILKNVTCQLPTTNKILKQENLKHLLKFIFGLLLQERKGRQIASISLQLISI